MPCLDDNTVAALIDGLLAEDALAEVHAHVDVCESCRLLLSNVAPLVGPAPSSAIERDLPTQHTISKTIELDHIKWNASIRVGSVLNDKWRLDRLLGVGGTAAVYEATHKSHGGRVAIKMIHAGLELDPEQRRRFLREGYAANAVGHPGIVSVIDDDVDEDGSIFLVSELAEGETLHARLGRLGPLPAFEVLAFTDAVLDILAAAHERGIVHRDIKPENILVEANGRTRLLDFGMALVREATYESTVTTARGLALGTPAFMSPEQALGLTEEVGPASDLWALGATMFTLMSGRLVHDAKTVTDAIRMAVKSPAPPLATVLPDLRAEVHVLVDRALAFEKADRWPSARAMQAETQRALTLMRPTARQAGTRRTWVFAAAALAGLVLTAPRWFSRESAEPPLAFPASSAIATAVATEIAPSAVPAPIVPPTTPVIELEDEERSTAHPIKSPVQVPVKPRPFSAPSVAPAAPVAPVASSWLDRRTR